MVAVDDLDCKKFVPVDEITRQPPTFSERLDVIAPTLLVDEYTFVLPGRLLSAYCPNSNAFW